MTAMPEPPGGWRTPEQIDREIAERGRRNREAQLVALVAAVPEGLDPIGWRAAVLGAHEMRQTAACSWPAAAGLLEGRTFKSTDREWLIGLLRMSADHPVVAAYQRAITPAPPVPRVRATWKTRGPVLPVDDGRDD